MRYLTVSADFNSSGVKDLDTGELDNTDLGLSDNLWSIIQEWNTEYRPIIKMSMEERAAVRERIDELDQRGLRVCKLIADELGDVKVDYYSEGLLKWKALRIQ